MTAADGHDGHLDDPISDFSHRRVDLDGVVKTVYVAGSGPAVVLMPEMPGISPDVLRLARWVRDAGFTVHVPSLFGVDGAYPTVAAGEKVVRRACVSAEFRAFAGGGTSPVTAWLHGLARQAHAACGGPGVGAIGLCFTGNFALTMALEPAVVAPVLGHPSLPLDDPAGLEINEEDARAVRERVTRDGLNVLAFRFDNDRWCTGQRFAAYRALLGDAFDGRVLPGSTANTTPPPFFRDTVGTPHSVVTAHFVDEDGHPTVKAREEILTFLSDRLLPSGRSGGQAMRACHESGRSSELSHADQTVPVATRSPEPLTGPSPTTAPPPPPPPPAPDPPRP